MYLEKGQTVEVDPAEFGDGYSLAKINSITRGTIKEPIDVTVTGGFFDSADGLVCRSAGLEILSAGEESEGRVTLREGKFHQVKRMLAYLGKPVLYLERIKMGNLPLDLSLSRGEFRFLTDSEVESLRAQVDSLEKP